MKEIINGNAYDTDKAEMLVTAQVKFERAYVEDTLYGKRNRKGYNGPMI